MKKVNKINVLLFAISFFAFLGFAFVEQTLWRWSSHSFYISQLPIPHNTLISVFLLFPFWLFAICTLLFTIFQRATITEDTHVPVKKKNYLITVLSVLISTVWLVNIGIAYQRVKATPQNRYPIQPATEDTVHSIFGGNGSAVVYVTFSEDDPATDAAIENLAENFPVAILHCTATGDSFTVATRDTFVTVYASDGPCVLVCLNGFSLTVYDKTAIADGSLLNTLQADANRPGFEMYYTPEMWQDQHFISTSGY